MTPGRKSNDPSIHLSRNSGIVDFTICCKAYFIMFSVIFMVFGFFIYFPLYYIFKYCDRKGHKAVVQKFWGMFLSYNE